jgi:hypothetical protein
VILAAIDQYGGPEWLSNAFAVVTLAAWLIIWRVLYLRTQSAATSLALVAVVFALSWSRFTTQRPENFAWLCFALLWWLLVGDQQRAAGSSRWRLWLGVPLVMLLWANLHGSFLIGLAVLGAYFVGSYAAALIHRTSDVGRPCRAVPDATQRPAYVGRLWRALLDPEVKSRLIAAELGFIATCVNPYGMDLILSALAFSNNPNLRDVLEWQPLRYGGPGGYEFVAAWALALVLLRLSRRPIALAHGIMLALLGLATLGSNRMIGWFALVYGVSLAPLLDDLLTRWRSQPAGDEEEPVRGFPLWGRSWYYTLIALVLLWIPFSLAPIAQPILGGKQRSPEQLFGRQTPLGLTKWLRETSPPGLVFTPQWWGDWIVRDGPPEIRPFMTSNIHLAPRQVWVDYLRILGVGPGWQQVLGRYAVETVIVDKRQSPELLRVLQKDTGWRLLYDDEQAAVFGVRKPR